MRTKAADKVQKKDIFFFSWRDQEYFIEVTRRVKKKKSK